MLRLLVWRITFSTDNVAVGLASFSDPQRPNNDIVYNTTETVVFLSKKEAIRRGRGGKNLE